MDDAAGAARTLNAIRELGVHLVIDDFGTGYSSLAYLKRFPVDTLKIDRSFVDGLGRDAESEAIVRAVVGLTQSLHLSVIAEGVETVEQLATLHRLGCDTYQGYFFAKPMPAEEVSFDIMVPDVDAGADAERRRVASPYGTRALRMLAPARRCAYDHRRSGHAGPGCPVWFAGDCEQGKPVRVRR